MAGPSAGIVAPYAGYPLGGTIKRYNPPFKVNGKNPFIDRIQYRLLMFICIG
jgi:hypothetical protein